MLFIYAGSIAAQTRYFDTTRTFQLPDGATYQADVTPGGRVTLFNIENSLTYVEQMYRDGSRISDADEDFIPSAENDMLALSVAGFVLQSVLRDYAYRIPTDRRLGVVMLFNSDTGWLEEVHFNFHNISPFATIPVEVYRRIEVYLRIFFSLEGSRINIVPTDEGRRRNFLFLGWHYDIHKDWWPHLLYWWDASQRDTRSSPSDIVMPTDTTSVVYQIHRRLIER
jgi:hypothetical protein